MVNVNVTFPIHTDRLTLRPFGQADFEAMHAYHSDLEVCRYLPWSARGREDSQAALERRFYSTQLSREGDALYLAVTISKTADLIGEVILFLRSLTSQQAELGYVFNPAFAGCGYATEAAKAMLELGFEQFKFHRIYARCDTRNIASYKLMERLNMRREAHFLQNQFDKGAWCDQFTYALLAPEWHVQHQHAEVSAAPHD
ncbi:MAG: GNAT family protein [Deinococcota bacterium]